jgi:amino acid transporter
MASAPHDAPLAANPAGTELEAGTVGLGQGIIFGMAGSAPGQVITLSLAALVAASAYGSLLPMLVCTAAMLCIAVSYQRLNMWKQNAGGPYAWVARAFNPYVGFMVGWVMLATYLLSVIIDVLSIGPALLGLIGADTSSQWGTVLFATVFGVPLTVVAVVGIRPSARLQVGMAAVEYAILLVFAIIAFVYVFVLDSDGIVKPSWDWVSSSGLGGGSLSAGILVSVFFLAGWDDAVYINEESERPATNPGKAAITAVALLGVFYLLMIAAFQGVVSQARLEAHSENVVPFLAGHMTGDAGQRIAAVAIVLSVLATTQAFIVATARIAFSMARDHVLPLSLGKVHKRYRTPALATVLCGAIGIVLTWVYVFASSVAGAIDDLIATIGVLFALFYAATALATVWFYRRRVTRTGRDALLVGVLPLLGAATLGWVAVKSISDLGSGPKQALVIIAVIGLVLMVIAAAVQRAPIFKIKMETADADGAYGTAASGDTATSTAPSE